MPQSLVNQILHIVFSTKARTKLITPDLADRLYPYLGGIARKHNCRLLAVGGMPDHVHLLLSIAATLQLSKVVQLLKGNSSKWIRETFPEHHRFEWQRGYGAFSIGVGDFDRTVQYIHNQPRHHQNRSFEDEYLAFVTKNSVPFDERYVFD